MADPAADPDADDADMANERREAEGMPRWVKVFLIIAVALVLLFVAAKLTGIGGGGHGPGRHGGGGSTPTSGGDHQSPMDHRP